VPGPTTSSSTSASQLSLKATVHSVRWDKDPKTIPSTHQSVQHQHQQRAWYGMMTLVPETAMIYGAQTLNDVRSSLSLSNQMKNHTRGEAGDGNDAVITIGCGIERSQPSHQESLMGDSTFLAGDEASLLSSTTRRRVQHQDPSGCNNSTNFFCWMQCLEVPNADQARGYVNEGYSLYCLDPAILATTGQVSDAASPCENGWVHNANCLGSWQPTAPDVPAANIDVEPDKKDNGDDPFCYGGTSMYMDGFHLVQSTTCVIYLFQSWVLNSGGKFAAATVGTFLAAIGLEKTIQQRRRTMIWMESSARPRTRLLATAVFYGTQLSLGYLLMLVIMIYSGVLFMATVLGLVTGHVLFNARDAFFPLREGPGAASIDGKEPEHGEDSAAMEPSVIVGPSGEPSSFAKGVSSATEGHEMLPAPSSCCLGGCLSKSAYRAPSEEDPLHHDSKNGTTSRYVVPEGITPCCQHTV
jgi:hypothetical protein